MARILITGSTDGLGLASARTLIDQGHDVVLHARTEERAATVSGLGAAGIVIGDLSSDSETRSIARQADALGRMDAVILNAGVHLSRDRMTTPEGHARTLAVNVLAPYLLTALLERPDRLVYVSSNLHQGASTDLSDIDWTEREWDADGAYAESKLYVAALASAVARNWPEVLSNSVDPGWVPTRMGGPSASDDLALGHGTQSWLAVSDDPEAKTSGYDWFHRRHQATAPAVTDQAFQEELLDALADLTGVRLFERG